MRRRRAQQCSAKPPRLPRPLNEHNAPIRQGRRAPPDWLSLATGKSKRFTLPERCSAGEKGTPSRSRFSSAVSSGQVPAVLGLAAFRVRSLETASTYSRSVLGESSRVRAHRPRYATHRVARKLANERRSSSSEGSPCFNELMIQRTRSQAVVAAYGSRVAEAAQRPPGCSVLVGLATGRARVSPACGGIDASSVRCPLPDRRWSSLPCASRWPCRCG